MSYLNFNPLISIFGTKLLIFCYIFMSVPGDGFMEKPKHIASFGNKIYFLKVRLRFTVRLFFLYCLILWNFTE